MEKALPIKRITCGSHHTSAISVAGEIFNWGDGEHVRCGAVVRLRPVAPARVANPHLPPRSVRSLSFLPFFRPSAPAPFYQGQLGRIVLRRHKKKGLLVHPVTFKNCADGLKTKRQCAADSVFSCGYRSFAILKNGMVFGWGLNNYGQLGVVCLFYVPLHFSRESCSQFYTCPPHIFIG